MSAASAQPYALQGQQYDGQRGVDRAASRDRGSGDDSRDARLHRQDWRDDRVQARWDDGQYNGYYDNNRWTYGPPPADRYGRPGFALGYQPWTRGQRLGYYNGRFEHVDYRQHNLRRPVRGSPEAAASACHDRYPSVESDAHSSLLSARGAEARAGPLIARSSWSSKPRACVLTATPPALRTERSLTAIGLVLEVQAPVAQSHEAK